jgi:hypothetical protein
MDRRIVLQLVGETMREIGALAALFVPLDSMFAEQPLESGVLIVWVAASLAMIACGILLVAKNR